MRGHCESQTVSRSLSAGQTDGGRPFVGSERLALELPGDEAKMTFIVSSKPHVEWRADSAKELAGVGVLLIRLG